MNSENKKRLKKIKVQQIAFQSEKSVVPKKKVKHMFSSVKEDTSNDLQRLTSDFGRIKSSTDLPFQRKESTNEASSSLTGLREITFCKDNQEKSQRDILQDHSHLELKYEIANEFKGSQITPQNSQKNQNRSNFMSQIINSNLKAQKQLQEITMGQKSLCD